MDDIRQIIKNLCIEMYGTYEEPEDDDIIPIAFNMYKGRIGIQVYIDLKKNQFVYVMTDVERPEYDKEFDLVGVYEFPNAREMARKIKSIGADNHAWMDLRDVLTFSTRAMREILEKNPGDNTFKYQLLSRLQSDCNYFLGNGNRCENHLWSGCVENHIADMKALWHSFTHEGKPEWLTDVEIYEYERRMKNA